MSQIPFLERLGDAIQAAIPESRPVPRRRSWLGGRRLGALALTAVLIVGGGVASARILAGDPETQTFRGVNCVIGPDAAAVIVPHGGETPAEACARAMLDGGRRHVPNLVACSDQHDSVVVVAGDDSKDCARQGLGPLSPAYYALQQRVRALSERVATLERSRDCIPPGELAAGIQRILQQLGWSGWRVATVSVFGPCGRSAFVDANDDGVSRVVSMNSDTRTYSIVAGPPRSTEIFLRGKAGLNRGFDGAMWHASGVRCFSEQQLRTYVVRKAAAAGRQATFTTSTWTNPNASLQRSDESPDPTWQRHQAGCWIVTGVAPAENGHDLVATLLEP